MTLAMAFVRSHQAANPSPDDQDTDARWRSNLDLFVNAVSKRLLGAYRMRGAGHGGLCGKAQTTSDEAKDIGADGECCN